MAPAFQQALVDVALQCTFADTQQCCCFGVPEGGWDRRFRRTLFTHFPQLNQDIGEQVI
jgi:hypothetical protein